MNKKIVIGCIGIVFMLVAITMVSAVGNKTTAKKESPLYKLRTNRANSNKNIKIIDNFLKDRVFYFPVILQDLRYENRNFGGTWHPTCIPVITCVIITCFILCK